MAGELEVGVRVEVLCGAEVRAFDGLADTKEEAVAAVLRLLADEEEETGRVCNAGHLDVVALEIPLPPQTAGPTPGWSAVRSGAGS